MVLATVPVWAGLVASSTPAGGATAPDWTAYVATEGNFNNPSDTITPIDTATNTAGAPVTVGSTPVRIAITPNGATAYVVNQGSNSVTPVTTSTGVAGTPVPVGNSPSAIAITPDGSTAYVANSGTLDAPGDTMTPINLATGTAETPIAVGSFPSSIGITPNGATAYVTSLLTGSVMPVDLATGTPGTPIRTGGGLPESIAITPNGTTAYVMNGFPGTVTPIALATGTAGTPITVPIGPQAIAMAPDGKTVYVASSQDESVMGYVTPIDVVTNTAGTPIAAGVGADSIGITPDGATAYVGDALNVGNGTVTPVDLATGTAGTAITTGPGPLDVAITPDQAPVAHLAVTPGAPGQASAFDASASTVATGRIVSYAWSFGDGSSAVTTAPQTTHTYAAAGTFTASVTETDSAGTSTTQVFTGQTMSRNGGPQATAAAKVTIGSSAPVLTRVIPTSIRFFGLNVVVLTGSGLTAAQHACLWSHLAPCEVSVHFGHTSAFVFAAAPTAALVLAPPGHGRVLVTVTVGGATSAPVPYSYPTRSR
jgi:YVTN family beta-propeller protein